ncbi:MAG: polymer-forming cytoskeletal protein [Minisyncoccales bacterium]
MHFTNGLGDILDFKKGNFTIGPVFVEGNFSFNGIVTVKSGAMVKASINAIGVHIEDGARVFGSIRAFHLINQGHVNADIKANCFHNMGTAESDVTSEASFLYNNSLFAGRLEAIKIYHYAKACLYGKKKGEVVEVSR